MHLLLSIEWLILTDIEIEAQRGSATCSVWQSSNWNLGLLFIYPSYIMMGVVNRGARQSPCKSIWMGRQTLEHTYTPRGCLVLQGIMEHDVEK